MDIQLNEAEQRLSQFLAKQRHANARSRGAANRRIGGQSDFETDLEGIATEIAVAKVFNVYPDLATDHIPDSDLLTKCGVTVDVKSTRYRNGKLLAVPWKKKGQSDFYVLVTGTFPTYRIAGAMASDDLLQEKRMTDLGRGKGYAASQPELQSIDEWLQEYGEI